MRLDKEMGPRQGEGQWTCLNARSMGSREPPKKRLRDVKEIFRSAFPKGPSRKVGLSRRS